MASHGRQAANQNDRQMEEVGRGRQNYVTEHAEKSIGDCDGRRDAMD